VSKPKVQVSPKATVLEETEPVQGVAASVFSDDEIRARAFQIYESRDRNSNTPDEDWSQAQIELTELLGGK
jgi:hypothetical protein